MIHYDGAVKGRHRWWLPWLSVVLAGPIVSPIQAAATTSPVAYPPTNPSVFEYAVPGAHFLGIVTGADGNFWLADQGNQSIDQLSFSTGVVTIFPIMGLQADPTDVAPRGRWKCLVSEFQRQLRRQDHSSGGHHPVHERSHHADVCDRRGTRRQHLVGDVTPALDKITPSGVVTRYPMPQGAAYNPDVTGIAVGSDGNIWVTDRPNNRILKLSTSGVFSPAFALPSTPAGRQPVGITAGADGNLWFGESIGQNGQIGRMTTSGQLTAEFPLDNTFGIVGIAAGPDGNVWFGEAGPVVDFAGVMTVTGRFRLFQTVTHLAGIGRPAAGPDGYMWYPEFVGNVAEAVPSGPWPPTSAWYANPQRPKSQALTTHSRPIPPKTIGTRAHAVPVKPNASQSTTPANRLDLEPVLSTTGRRILSSLEGLFR